jgi:tetratricopeptide (TPR) repeat protein
VRRLDRFISAGLIFLLASSALFFGAVHRWAYVFAEAVVLLMVLAWALRMILNARYPERRWKIPQWHGLALPLVLLIALIGFQLLPLPPAAIRLISPSTYHLYELSFPGWPQRPPLEELQHAYLAAPAKTAPAVAVLPPATSAAKAGAVDGAPNRKGNSRQADGPGWTAMRWRALAIAPQATWSALLEVIVCAALFLMVLTYPFEDDHAEAAFFRTLIVGVISVAAAVALIGLAERLAWNGKILWIFVPHDWGAPQLSNVRASGPFVDPDHFADYLAMVLPLTLVGAVFSLPLVKKPRRDDFKFLCGGAALLIGAGVVLSLSRAGWVAAAFGIWLMLTLSLAHAPEQAPSVLRHFGKRRWPATLAMVTAGIIVLLIVVGPAGRENVATRVNATVTQAADLNYRPAIWRDSLGMIRDFPLFGVGLGCWPEIFNHYLRPPWIQFFYREAENDYLQFIAETGVAGAIALIWFAWAAIGGLRRGARSIDARRWPLYAGLIAGLAAAMLHEFVEFSMRTPANAFLFAVLLALTLRFAAFRGGTRTSFELKPRTTYLAAGGTAIAAGALIAAVLTQPFSAYPSDIGNPKTFTAAERTIDEHPASSTAHLAIARLLGPDASNAARLEQLHAAVWLDPNNPFARDLYARQLAIDGSRAEALKQLSLSMFHSPELSTHFYLTERLIPWLLPPEQRAIEGGLREALRDHIAGALETLAAFYTYLGRYSDAADEYTRMAARTTDSAEKLEYLLAAGKQYGNAGRTKPAEAVLTAAARIAPADPRPYAELARVLCVNGGGARAAIPIIERGASEGAPPYNLYMALADAAEAVHDDRAAEQALLKALSYQPASYQGVMELGGIYMREKKYDAAVLEFRQAAELDPHSVSAYSELAQAAEAGFYYAEADKAYARAVALAPADRNLREQYADFQERTAKSAAELHKAEMDPALQAH